MNSKIKYFILLLSCIFAFTACDGGEQQTEDTSDTSVTCATDEDGNEIPPPAPTKVGFVYNGLVENGGTINEFEAAREQIEKALGVETCYIESVLVSDFAEAADILIADGCNVIVAASTKYSNVVKKTSQSNADVDFISFGGDSALSNLASFQSKLYQTANVCGLVAAYNSDSNVLGILCDPNCYMAYTIIDAYALGAKEITGAATDIRLNWAFSDQQKHIEEAIDDLVSQGCDVIMCYTETDFAVEYCEELGVKVIGNSYNMPELAPENCLSGFFLNLNTYLVDTVRSIKNDLFTGSVYEGGISEGAVRLVDINTARCYEGTKEVADTLLGYVKSGSSVIFMGEIKDNNNTVKVEKGQSLKHSQCVTIQWLDSAVRRIIDFTEPVLEPVTPDFDIKGKNPMFAQTETASAETQAPEEAPAA